MLKGTFQKQFDTQYHKRSPSDIANTDVDDSRNKDKAKENYDKVDTFIGLSHNEKRYLIHCQHILLFNFLWSKFVVEFHASKCLPVKNKQQRMLEKVTPELCTELTKATLCDRGLHHERVKFNHQILKSAFLIISILFNEQICNYRNTIPTERIAEINN